MPKVMLVEDDTNLSEIYQARMQAEGYQVISANDGEEALAVAAREKPDLIVSDVMMPKISGFEMLDILRNTEGLKETKVIMLTALGQAEDKTRADSLGADRYLVKSQVTLEDIVTAARELLGTEEATTPAAESSSEPTVTPAAAMPAATIPLPDLPPVTSAAVTPPPAPAVTQPTPAPVAIQPTPVASMPVAVPVQVSPVTAAPTPAMPPIKGLSFEQPAGAPAAPQAAPDPQVPAPIIMDVAAPPTTSTPDAAPVVPVQPPVPIAAALPTPAATPPADQLMTDAVAKLLSSVGEPIAQPGQAAQAPAPVQSAPAAPAPAVTGENDDSADGNVAHKKIIQPISDPTNRPDLNQLLAAEEAKYIETPQPKVVVIDDKQSAPQPSQPHKAPQPLDQDHQPGNIVAPQAGPVQTPAVDPNSISL